MTTPRFYESLRPYKRLLEVIGVGGALIWAAILRLGWPGVNAFAFDEAQLSRLALDFARNGHFPLLGMVSSAGIPNMPGAVWLFALPYALTDDPLVATLFIGAVNVLVVLLLWWLVRQSVGVWPALVTLWLTAGAPYLVFYSRSIWAQNWLPALGALWAWAAWRALHQRPWAMLGQALVAGFAFQVHYAGASLLLPSLALLILVGRRGLWRYALAGWGLAGLLALPSLRALLPLLLKQDLSLAAKTTSAGASQTPLILMKLIAGYHWDALLLGPQWGLGDNFLMKFTGSLLLGLVAAGFGAAFVRWRQRWDDNKRLWLLVVFFWALSAPLLWLLLPAPVRFQYHLASLPAFFIIAGLSITLFSSARMRIGILALAVLISLGQGWDVTEGLTVVQREITPGGVSTPLIFTRNATRSVKQGDPVIGVTSGVDLAADGDANMLDALFWGYPHRLVDGEHGVIIPRQVSWLFFASPWIQARAELDRAYMPLPEANQPVFDPASYQFTAIPYETVYLPKREGETPFAAVHITSQEPPTGFHFIAPVALANGAELLGWRLVPRGVGLRLSTLWRITGDDKYQAVHQFDHIYARDDNTPVFGSDVALPSGVWQRGDYVISWADFTEPLPPGDYRVGVGMYHYPSMRRVPQARGVDPLAPIWIANLSH